MNTSNKTLLSRANLFFNNKKYSEALSLYQEALLHADQTLKPSIELNINFTKKLISKEQTKTNKCFTKENTDSSKSSNTPDTNIQNNIEDIKKHFDSNYYRTKYPDIQQANVNPIEHYCTAGWLERRDPCPDFSTAYYLDANPDIITAGINPFWHYIVAGKSEGRLARHPGGYKAEILKSLPSLEQTALQWRKEKVSLELRAVAQVIQLILQHKTPSHKHLAISVGHDHYKKISGGIQLCIQREEKIASAKGVLYLNAHPWQPLPRLASKNNELDPLVSLIIAGEDAGVCQTSCLIQALGQIAEHFHGNTHLIIHSLLGHSIEQIKKLAQSATHGRCFFWVHDFFSLCPSFTLQRNTISFCDAPNIDSNSCEICIFSHERRTHMKRMLDFFTDVAVTTIFPSIVTQSFWNSKSILPNNKQIVVPHLIMEWTNICTQKKQINNKPVSVGFLGAPVYHKGWHTFENLLKILTNKNDFRFVYFGNHTPPTSGIDHVKVHVTASDGFAMMRAVSEENMDYILHWATWPETFSFTAHEAISAGSYILTNEISGNVAAIVKDTKTGSIFETEDSLIDFFTSGLAAKKALNIRDDRSKRSCQTRYSDMTIPLLITGENS